MANFVVLITTISNVILKLDLLREVGMLLLLDLMIMNVLPIPMQVQIVLLLQSWSMLLEDSEHFPRIPQYFALEHWFKERLSQIIYEESSIHFISDKITYGSQRLELFHSQHADQLLVGMDLMHETCLLILEGLLMRTMTTRCMENQIL